MKYIKKLNNEDSYNNWIISNDYKIPHVIKQTDNHIYI